MVGGDGVEPPEPFGSRFTVCPATTYGITAHIELHANPRRATFGRVFPRWVPSILQSREDFETNRSMLGTQRLMSAITHAFCRKRLAKDVAIEF